MSMTIQRSQEAAGQLAWRFGSQSLAINSQLIVQADECVVVCLNGAVLGVITSGNHWLHPQPFPFLGQAIAGSNVQTELWFVKTTKVMGLQFGGLVGDVVEADLKIPCHVRSFGDFSLVATNPIAVVVALLSSGTDDSTPLVQWAAGLILHELKDIVTMAAEVEEVSFLKPDMVRRISELLPTRLDAFAQAGLQLGEIGSVTLSISEEDQAALKAAAQKRAAARNAKVTCGRCNTEHSGGRFCVQCGAPLGT